LSTRASAIGTGKNRISCTRLSTRVFSSADQNSGSLNIDAKVSSPTHGLCMKPA